MADTKDLMELIDAYAESRHVNGAAEFNVTTAGARQAVVDALAARGEPVVYRVSDPDEPELGQWFEEEPPPSYLKSEPLYTAPQPNAALADGWLNPDDLAALERFSECSEDSEADGHDVPKERMKRLAELGAVQARGFGRHETTAFGRLVLGCQFARRPLETTDECNARLGREHRAKLEMPDPPTLNAKVLGYDDDDMRAYADAAIALRARGAVSSVQQPGAVPNKGFNVELPEKAEARFANWIGVAEMTPWRLSVARLALLLNSTKRGLIDYEAAQHFADELMVRVAAPDAPEAAGAREYHAALQRVGTALGLAPGANILTDCVPAIEALRAAAPMGAQPDYPHEQMDAMTLARYKVVPSHESMFHRHAVVAGDGNQQLYVGRELDCQNMARKFAGAFLDGAFAFHRLAATQPPTARREQDAHQANGLAWAVHRWESEVKERPMGNVHRRSLDDAWRQVVRYFGGNPDALLGPSHDAAMAAKGQEGAPAKPTEHAKNCARNDLSAPRTPACSCAKGLAEGGAA
ncbi:hypothetical protein AVMA1855_16795 [Acidovorax sp. SUPP1855]|uniref:hypothetical protein n=1 Tax=Acidovorax sp. SUPP1855 TaxID=431774 RepID=UPI0023DE42F4|nr:hypothetical protein [Acidovorax sp. SUPP1855]GKS85833.1 hypothetical protein AVMA1855_16795 [Acidovorax sp. SUPP1855]